MWHFCYFDNSSRPGREFIKNVHAQLLSKFQLLIKTKMVKNKDFSCFQTLRCCIYHANKCKIPTTVGILTFMSMINLCSVEVSMKRFYNLKAYSLTFEWIAFLMFLILHICIMIINYLRRNSQSLSWLCFLSLMHEGQEVQIDAFWNWF